MKNFRFTYYLFLALSLFARIESATETISIYDDMALRNQCLQDNGNAETIAYNFVLRNEFSAAKVRGDVSDKAPFPDDEREYFLNKLKTNPSLEGIFSDEVAEKLARFIVDKKLGLDDNARETAYQVGWQGWHRLWIRKCKVLLGKEQTLPDNTSTDVVSYITMIKKLHPLLGWYALKWYQKYAEAQYVANQTDQNIYLLQQLEAIEKVTYDKRKDFVACIHAPNIASFPDKSYHFGPSTDDANKKKISSLYISSCLMLGINDFRLTSNEKKGIEMLRPYYRYYYLLFLAMIFGLIWLVMIVGSDLLRQLEEAYCFFEAHPELEPPYYVTLYREIKKRTSNESKFSEVNPFML